MGKDELDEDGTAGGASCCTFGEHLTIDGYGGSPERLNDQDLVYQILDQLPEILGMKKLAEPWVYFAPGNGAKDPGGWSGFVVISESHISVHTFPGRRFVSADIYSCKNGMNPAFIEGYFKKKFALQDLETHFLKRGTKYPVFNQD
ncbi:MAG: S-adenosylmethionine decarboxylase [Nitrospirae bacterium]|nr:S-adenosylmethionine decarboxylase [Nitrospirota bacterium]